MGNQFPIGHDIGLFHKLSVTANYFEKTILPNSAKKVYIILFYNDWCFRCIKIIEPFKKLIDILEPLGMILVIVYFKRVLIFREMYRYKFCNN